MFLDVGGDYTIDQNQGDQRGWYDFKFGGCYGLNGVTPKISFVEVNMPTPIPEDVASL